MAAVTLAAAWWMEPTGTGRVKRYRGEVLNLTDEDAARLVRLGAATVANPTPAPAKTAAPSKARSTPAPAARRKPAAKKAAPTPPPANK